MLVRGIYTLALATIGAFALAITVVLPATTGMAHAQATPTSAGRQAGQGVPDPSAPHSGKIVPGITGAAAAAAVPASAVNKFRQMHGQMSREASTPRLITPAATARPADIAPWPDMKGGWWGTYGVPTTLGAQATQSLNPSIRLSDWDNDTIYAPSFFPSGWSTIEMTTIYWSNDNWVAAYNWGAPPEAQSFEKMASVSTLGNYITTINGLANYSVQIVQTNATANAWTAYLYNYRTKAWDTFFTSANTEKLSLSGGGWDYFETYSHYNPATGQGNFCTDTYSAFWTSRGLKYKIGPRTWASAAPSNSYIAPAQPVSTDFGCYSLSFSVITPNSYWQVIN